MEHSSLSFVHHLSSRVGRSQHPGISLAQTLLGSDPRCGYEKLSHSAKRSRVGVWTGLALSPVLPRDWSLCA
ncbi:hypothetical protein KIN20_007294 [Parelaphostrongylus tenuis]|uniref:Uncharacterized protein n=1 Tax=Parelaphostrongylus tenuis TaxID=148309 RepID=A0AAD5QJ22_PARTN|nr:hypothetical protein KIN20_007294 [Parelaphostrongylus tenuis]